MQFHADNAIVYKPPKKTSTSSIQCLSTLLRSVGLLWTSRSSLHCGFLLHGYLSHTFALALSPQHFSQPLSHAVTLLSGVTLNVALRLLVRALITFCDDIIADFQPMSWELRWRLRCCNRGLSNNILTATVRLSELYFKLFMHTCLKKILPWYIVS